jgi:DNA invertase Pin-like site-specific DNA recombinase
MRLQAYCQARDWTLVNVYEDDSTGRETDRPGYQRMLADRDGWDVALVMKLDRIHRRQRNFLTMVEQFATWGKAFVSVADNLDMSTAIGRFVVDLMARLAELESDQIGERVVPAMEQAKEKQLHQGAPPLGFKWNKDDKKFVPMKWAEELRTYADQHGVTAASRTFTYPEGKKKGKPVSRTAARRILKNFARHESGQLLPNRERSAPGTHSKIAKPATNLLISQVP